MKIRRCITIAKEKWEDLDYIAWSNHTSKSDMIEKLIEKYKEEVNKKSGGKGNEIHN